MKTRSGMENKFVGKPKVESLSFLWWVDVSLFCEMMTFSSSFSFSFLFSCNGNWWIGNGSCVFFLKINFSFFLCVCVWYNDSLVCVIQWIGKSNDLKWCRRTLFLTVMEIGYDDFLKINWLNFFFCNKFLGDWVAIWWIVKICLSERMN